MIHSQPLQVLVIDDFHGSLNERLATGSLRIDYRPDFNLKQDQDLLAQCDILVLRSKLEIQEELLQGMPRLKCIARGGAGLDNIDVEAAEKRGIRLLNAPEGNRDAVAEHCVGLLLSLSKNISKSQAQVKNHLWKREANRGWEIGGKTIGLIGFGNTGSALAQKLSGFNCRVMAYDKYKTGFQSASVEEVGLDQVLNEADVISLHLPLSRETRFLVDAEFIQRMKDGVVLINSSRGAICRTEAVWAGIQSNKIKSFAADVLEDENPVNWHLEKNKTITEMLKSDRVILTPHVAGWTQESYRKIAEVLAGKILDFTTKLKNI